MPLVRKVAGSEGAVGKTFVKPRKPQPCDRKKSYATYAQAVAMAVIRTGSSRETPELLTPYYCQYCGQHHLSSQANRSGRFPAITA